MQKCIPERFWPCLLGGGHEAKPVFVHLGFAQLIAKPKTLPPSAGSVVVLVGLAVAEVGPRADNIRPRGRQCLGVKKPQMVSRNTTHSSKRSPKWLSR